MLYGNTKTNNGKSTSIKSLIKAAKATNAKTANASDSSVSKSSSEMKRAGDNVAARNSAPNEATI